MREIARRINREAGHEPATVGLRPGPAQRQYLPSRWVDRGRTERTDTEGQVEATDRAVPGHWEGDLIVGTNRSAIGAVIERKSRPTLLVHLSWLDGYGQTPRVKIGPALVGYGVVAMNATLRPR